jgi:hypothetical protein
MSPDTHALIVTTLLQEMRKRLDEAAISARAAETYVVAGSPDQVGAIALDVEQRTHEANVLFKAASIIDRIAKEG